MIKKHKNSHIDERIGDTKVETFLSEIIEFIKYEIQDVCDSFFSFSDETKDGVFCKSEMTWTGIVNNTIIRNSKNANCILECPLYDDAKFNPLRSDLLVYIKDISSNCNLIIESKIDDYRGDWVKESHGYYNEALLQAKSYYTLEKAYYKDKSYLVALYFSIVSDIDNLNIAIEYFNDLKKRKDDETHFLALFYGNEKGIIIHGRVITPQEI